MDILEQRCGFILRIQLLTQLLVLLTKATAKCLKCNCKFNKY